MRNLRSVKKCPVLRFCTYRFMDEISSSKYLLLWDRFMM
jgi:hypothetical protein